MATQQQKKQKVCEKFDPTKCHPEMSIDEVILSQYDYAEDELPIFVSMLYMPEEEQEKMKEWMLENLKIFKGMDKKVVEKEMSWIVLDIFPSTKKQKFINEE